MHNNNKYKTGLRRFLAAWADGIMLGLITLWFQSQLLTPGSGNPVLYYSIIIATPIIYSILMHGLWGWTLGKRILYLKVVRNSDEKEIGFVKAGLRDVVPLLIVMFCIYSFIHIYTTGDKSALVKYEPIYSMVDYIYALWLLLEIITMLFNKKRRALHDFMANTVVVNTNLRKSAEEIEATASMRPQMSQD